MLDSISSLFHTTTDNDTAIAQRLTAQGIPLSARQVKDARLLQGWRRRNNKEEQQQLHRQSTADMIADRLAEGTARNYGRNYIITALRVNGHRARRDNVAAELQW